MHGQNDILSIRERRRSHFIVDVVRIYRSLSRMNRTCVAVMVCVTATFFACGSSSNSGTTSSTSSDDAQSSLDAASVCAIQCNANVACDPATDLQKCTTECMTGPIGAIDQALQALRPNAVPLVYACIENEVKDCEEVYGLAYPHDCMNRAAQSLTASVEAYKFCDAYGLIQSACIYRNLVSDPCLWAAQAIEDDQLVRATACLDKTCSSYNDSATANEIDDCVYPLTAIAFANVDAVDASPAPGGG